MKATELRRKVDALRARLDKREKSSVQMATKSGPVGIEIVEAVTKAIEAIDERLEKLEQRGG